MCEREGRSFHDVIVCQKSRSLLVRCYETEPNEKHELCIAIPDSPHPKPQSSPVSHASERVIYEKKERKAHVSVHSYSNPFEPSKAKPNDEDRSNQFVA